MNLKGMISASVVSSSKALNGELSEFSHTQKALGYEVSDIGLNELINLSNMLNKTELLENGVCEIDGYMVSAIPTILIDKPKTLVGMGDTISSVSLLGGW
jgi:ADP-dependent phosphofructokinase/glucokinase